MEIRAVTAADGAPISALARAAFPSTRSGFVRPGTDGGLVAAVDGKVAAATLVRVIRLPGGARQRLRRVLGGMTDRLIQWNYRRALHRAPPSGSSGTET